MQTITHRVREFLRQQGAAIEPWSGLDSTYTELYALLDRRRDDAALWGPLEQLLGEVLERATDPAAERRLAAPAAELLSSWDAAELVASLRKALSGRALSDEPAVPLADGAREYRMLTRRLSPAVLGAFLVLGLAATGCAGAYDADPEGTGGVGGGGTGGGDTGGAVTGGGGTGGGVVTGGVGGGMVTCAIDDAQVLATTINDSALTVDSKSSLCDCMTQLSQNWRDGLTTLFQTGTAEQIATALEEMLACCASGRTSAVYSQDALLDGTLCEPFAGTGGVFMGSGGGVVYKGVTFPD